MSDVYREERKARMIIVAGLVSGQVVAVPFFLSYIDGIKASLTETQRYVELFESDYPAATNRTMIVKDMLLPVDIACAHIKVVQAGSLASPRKAD